MQIRCYGGEGELAHGHAQRSTQVGRVASLDGPAGGLELLVNLLAGFSLGFHRGFPFANLPNAGHSPCVLPRRMLAAGKRGRSSSERVRLGIQSLLQASKESLTFLYTILVSKTTELFQSEGAQIPRFLPLVFLFGNHCQIIVDPSDVSLSGGS